MGANISQLYRQSLQPYVDPEILEGVDYLPEIPEVTVNVPNVTVRKDRQGERFFILLLAVLCLFGVTYNHAVNFAQKLPMFPLMSHSASE